MADLDFRFRVSFFMKRIKKL